jgi:hypothetical protein
VWHQTDSILAARERGTAKVVAHAVQALTLAAVTECQ